MARPEWRDGAKERFWRRTVAAWRRSGLTIRDYCDVHSLAEHNFYAWRRELARRQREQVQGPKRPRPDPTAAVRLPPTKKRRRPTSPATPVFSPVRLCNEESPGAASALCTAEPERAAAALEIVVSAHGRQRLLRVPPGFDRATLAQVLAVLEDRPC